MSSFFDGMTADDTVGALFLALLVESEGHIEVTAPLLGACVKTQMMCRDMDRVPFQFETKGLKMIVTLTPEQRDAIMALAAFLTPK